MDTVFMALGLMHVLIFIIKCWVSESVVILKVQKKYLVYTGNKKKYILVLGEDRLHDATINTKTNCYHEIKKNCIMM